MPTGQRRTGASGPDPMPVPGSPSIPASGGATGRDVLVQREHVRRVVLILERHESLELLWAVEDAQAVRPLVGADEVGRGGIGRPGPHRLHHAAGPRDVLLAALRVP